MTFKLFFLSEKPTNSKYLKKDYFKNNEIILFRLVYKINLSIIICNKFIKKSCSLLLIVIIFKSSVFKLSKGVKMKFIKEKYIPLNIIDTQEYIKIIKDTFERELAKYLNLKRISAPIFVTSDSGLQDNLSGVERRVAFDIKKDNKTLEIVQSLAKWKRLALYRYNFELHTGLYTDMTAIRRDEMIDEIHSIYVDQWDWEKVIEKQDRNLEYLYSTVDSICKAIKSTSKKLKRVCKIDLPNIKEKCFFITSQELLNMYPNKSPK